ncbi:MAG: hypothetical protein ACTSRS_01715 [Candidatus Helarchaeota archaeon]
MSRLYDLYIINRNGLCLLHQKFGTMEVDSDLVGGFFSAIQQFLQDILPSGESNIKALDRGDFKLLIEHGKETDIFGVAISEREDIEVRRKLIEITKEFETRYKDNLLNFNGDVGQFQSFKNFILSKFPSQLITPKHIPEIVPKMEIIQQIINAEVHSVELGGVNYVVTDDHQAILRQIDGQRTIEEIAEITEIDSKQIVEFISLLVWNNLLNLYIRPVIHETDIFQTKDADIFMADTLERQIVVRTFGEKGLDFLIQCKGGLSVADLAELSGMDIEMAKRMAAYFLVNGYIQKTGTEDTLSIVDLQNSPLAIYSQALKMAKGDEIGDLLKTIFNAGQNAATDFCQRTSLIYESDGIWFGNMFDVIVEVISFFHKYIDHTYSGKTLNIISRDCFECYNFRFYEPVCYFTTGLINGVFNFCKSKKMIEESMDLEVKEEECKATGAKACTWSIRFVKQK